MRCHPGYTLTPMNLRPEVAEQRKIFERDTPMGRMATVDEMVAGGLFVQRRGLLRDRHRPARRWRFRLLVRRWHGPTNCAWLPAWRGCISSTT